MGQASLLTGFNLRGLTPGMPPRFNKTNNGTMQMLHWKNLSTSKHRRHSDGHQNQFYSKSKEHVTETSIHRQATGVIQERVQKATPQRFGIVSVDCAKRRSKWLLCDYFGRVIIEPTIVEHNAGCLAALTQQVQAACEAEGIVDCIAAVEMTDIYHKPIVAAFQKAEVETRIVHPLASLHYRKPLHPDNKTDESKFRSGR